MAQTERRVAGHHFSQGRGKHMILSTMRMTIPPQKQCEALRILRSMAEQSRFDRGCLGCHNYGDLREAKNLMFEESWKTETDLEAHLRSDEYLELLLVLEMSLTQPEIRFDTISASKGIEAIEKRSLYNAG
jgi:quinol monooxygenase YgiN